MKNLAENFLVRFINISMKKDGVFANFKVAGMRNGMQFRANISVDLDSAGVDLTDPMEAIIQACGKVVMREFKRGDVQLEGVTA